MRSAITALRRAAIVCAFAAVPASAAVPGERVELNLSYSLP